MKGSINSIETFGAVDGPGIRVVVFMNGCTLRCKYCHNPEMWHLGGFNYTPEELVDKIKRYKPYFKNNGGVTFSGGEPLLQKEFLTETIKLLKKEGIHIALDTAGIYQGDIEEIIDNVDLVIYDIKDITEDRYHNLTTGNINTTLNFIKLLNAHKKHLWLRQVIVPNIHDNQEYLEHLNKYIKTYFDPTLIEKIEFLPYHKLGSEKYNTLGILNPYQSMEEMDPTLCSKLYEQFIELYKNKF